MSTHLQVSQSDRHRTPLMSVAGYVAMTIVVLIIAVPLFWIVITSFKERQDIYVRPAQYWPSPATTDNYRDTVTSIPFPAYFRNSLIITALLAAAKITLGVLSAYALSLLRFPGRNLIFLVVIAALMVPTRSPSSPTTRSSPSSGGATPSRASSSRSPAWRSAPSSCATSSSRCRTRSSKRPASTAPAR